MIATLGDATLVAQSADSSWPPDSTLDERVRKAVAARWEVAPSVIQLEWGPLREGRGVDAGSEFEILGEGAGGNWIVVFNSAHRSETAIRVWLRAGIEVLEPVATRALERGQPLGPADIEYVSRVNWGVPEPDAPQVSEGWITRRRLRAGESLRVPSVAPPLAVRTGEMVQVVWQRSGLALTLPARALGSAVVGARVQVRTESGRRLNGVATDIGVVEIGAVPEVKR